MWWRPRGGSTLATLSRAGPMVGQGGQRRASSRTTAALSSCDNVGRRSCQHRTGSGRTIPARRPPLRSPGPDRAATATSGSSSCPSSLPERGETSRLTRKATRPAMSACRRVVPPTTGRPTADIARAEARSSSTSRRIRGRADRRHPCVARRVRAHGRRRRQLRPRRPRRLPPRVARRCGPGDGQPVPGADRAGCDAVPAPLRRQPRAVHARPAVLPHPGGRLPLWHPGLPPGPGAGARAGHVRHGVRQRDGGPGVAGGAANPQCRRCCARSRARTCAWRDGWRLRFSPARAGSCSAHTCQPGRRSSGSSGCSSGRVGWTGRVRRPCMLAHDLRTRQGSGWRAAASDRSSRSACSGCHADVARSGWCSAVCSCSPVHVSWWR